MDAVAQLVAEHVVHEPMLGEPRHALERGSGDDRVEMMSVAGDGRDGAGDTGFDPGFELVWSGGHVL